MAERSSTKAKRPASAKAPAKSGAGGALEAENTRLKAELAEAHERIADLELKNAEALNRIERVIDSLHKLPE